LIPLIKSSGLTLYPSLLDSFGLVVLESLACGVPVVAYNIPAIRENYKECPAVLRCPVKDVKSMATRTISLLKNENLRTVLSENAEEYSAKHDWGHVVESEKEAYFKVIGYFNSKKNAPNWSGSYTMLQELTREKDMERRVFPEWL
jgi:glycosyltransferase involved in cell wall biosynthesis